jgi:hypothetical protein
MNQNEQHKATDVAATAAKRFFEELLTSVESLTGLADEFGVNTLADVLYLQNAILVGEQIDVWPDETDILAVLGKLPSAQEWMNYTKLGGEWADACERTKR